MKLNPILLTDFYKVHHNVMYPKGTTLIYSNFTPRKSRIKNIDGVVVFGIQYLIKEYLIKEYNQSFFWQPLEKVLEQYKEEINVDVEHIRQLHLLGYLPIRIKALPEGSICPIGVPMMTIENTLPEFYWLTNYLETLISCVLWQPITSATIALSYKKLLSKYAQTTCRTADLVQWQGHDFSMRGMSSPESAILSAMGHMLCFTGTDTIPAIYALKKYYNANGLVGGSVPATEHSVMCMGTKDCEIDTFKNLLNLFPTGILSVVSDTWNLWEVCSKILPQLKEQILSRDGKLVIRPDSGDPVEIICGNQNVHPETPGLKHAAQINKGVIELLWEVFGGTIEKGGDGNDYKVLDSHIGAIYGDSITMERAEAICERLKQKGFASSNIVFGIGSYTYQYNTRDTFGFAMKATFGIVDGQEREIFKDPVTDDGTKKSKKGRLCVFKQDGKYVVQDQCTPEMMEKSELITVFNDGKIINETNLAEIRARLQ